jgi:hypothetical protein
MRIEPDFAAAASRRSRRRQAEVGSVVQFQRRPAEAKAKARRIVKRLEEFYRQKQRAKEALPEMLARLVQAGMGEVALEAICLWGTGQREPDELLSICEEAVAVFASSEGHSSGAGALEPEEDGPPH